jgi:hypothetical protein
MSKEKVRKTRKNKSSLDAVRSEAPPTGKSKVELVQEAFDDAFRSEVSTYIKNVILGDLATGNPVEIFLNAINRLKDTQAKVLQLLIENAPQ